MRNWLTTLAEVAGAALMAVGTAMVSVPAGLIVAGMMLVGLGFLAGGS